MLDIGDFMTRPNQQINDAFNSMLRTDYVPLKDTAKLNLLAEYYVDYYNFLNQILSENDQLIVGRRGTGKTTLLYRALVDCMRSWEPQTNRS
jgi:predicted AAA+ superfamily ATPase